MRDYMSSMASFINGNMPVDTQAFQVSGFDPEYARIYSNNSASALSDALRSNFPTVTALIGEENAKHLARKYRESHPVTRRTLVGYGEGFPDFITAQLTLHKLPYLYSFSKLDRAWTQAHIASDTQPLTLQNLGDILERDGQLETHRVFLTPDAQLVELNWPVFDIWVKLRLGHEMSESIALEETPQQVLVWRNNNEVMYIRLAPEECAFLNAISKGQTLGEALNTAILSSPDGDVSTLLPKMVEAEIFKGNPDA